MKQEQINKKVKDGVSIVTGRLQSYKAEETAKSGCNEKFGILVGRQVLDFTVWAPKGSKLADIKRPAFVETPGVVVAALEADIRVDGKYLRTGCESVVPVES